MADVSDGGATCWGFVSSSCLHMGGSGCPPTVCHKPEEADPDKAGRERMQQEAPQEFVGGQGHGFVLAAIPVIFPPECNFAFGKGNESMIGYSDTVGILGQVFQHILRTTKWSLGMHHPAMAMSCTQEGMECFFVGQELQVAGQTELAFAECPLETGNELASEYFTKHAARQKEAIPWMDPGFVIGRESAGGDYAVDMGMEHQVLSPGMEHAEEPDFGAQMLGISRDLTQSCSAGSEQ